MKGRICSYTFDEYVQMVMDFHGHAAPGVILGGFMVDMALRLCPKGDLIDALSETSKCLPDAIQLLTPCTIGNGWLKVINLGRFALAMYEKGSGDGVRVFVDPNKLDGWPWIRTWLFKTLPKREQDADALISEMDRAGEAVLGHRFVRVTPDLLKKERRGPMALCPGCGESYPEADGRICLGCQGKAPYLG